MPVSPIILALDVAAPDQAMALVERTRPLAGAYKIGKELFVSAGPAIVREIRQAGAAVFLDLKFHDIPNTVARAVAAAARLDVQMLTVHATGGRAMLEAAAKAARETARELNRPAPLVLGVTVLTSLDNKSLAEVGMPASVARQVERLATLCVQAGLPGLVCSPLEVAFLRQSIPAQMQLVTPGIRTAGIEADDQKRTLSAAEAMAAGANWLVIGRPVCGAPNPRLALQNILRGIGLDENGGRQSQADFGCGRADA